MLNIIQSIVTDVRKRKKKKEENKYSSHDSRTIGISLRLPKNNSTS